MFSKKISPNLTVHCYIHPVLRDRRATVTMDTDSAGIDSVVFTGDARQLAEQTARAMGDFSV